MIISCYERLIDLSTAKFGKRISLSLSHSSINIETGKALLSNEFLSSRLATFFFVQLNFVYSLRCL